ncbi:hypothetical protein A2U01_0100613, partial [Trifolium medium]|nr:hypothetical protein [Trifolium medium]
MDQSLVDPGMIGARLDREDHDSILHNYDWEGAETTLCQNCRPNQIRQSSNGPDTDG